MKGRWAHRLPGLILALALLLCACGQDVAPDGSGQAEGNYPKADGVLPGDTVLFTAAGGTVDWQEFYYWTVASLEMTQAETGGLPGWEEIVGTMTFEEFTKLDAVKAALLYRVVEQKAGEMSVTLSQAEEEALETPETRFGGEAAFQKYLEENHLTKALYCYFQRVSGLYGALFAGYFGENGEKCTDEDAVSVLESEGYVRAKQLRAETLEEAQALLAELEAAGAEAESRFDALTGEDAGGRLYSGGQLPEALETAARALEGNRYSDVVEADGGYYIIMRLPIDPDQLLGEDYTVRRYAAAVLFEDMVTGWMEQALESVRYSQDYENLSLKDVFG